MISYTKGDIFDSTAEAIVNTVNTQGVMGKGLALQFKERYPANYKAYRAACKAGHVRVGEMFVTEASSGLLSPRRLIVNFPTKTEWRKPSEYSYITEGLVALRTLIESAKIKSIAIPPLGSSNGGLSWPVVRKMIEDALADIDCDVIIYEPNDAIAARMRSEKVKLTPARAMLISVMADMMADEEMPSEFACEKICYFLQRFGAADAFRLTYSRSFYGPYSGSVRHILHQLNGSYIMGVSDMSQHPFDPVWITEDADVPADAYLDSIGGNYKEAVEKTKRLLSGCYANFLIELLATVDFVIQEFGGASCAESDSDLTARVIESLHGWSNRKRIMFGTTQNINFAIARLREFGLICVPNQTTKAAMDEARSGKLKDETPVDTSSVDAMFKSAGL